MSDVIPTSGFAAEIINDTEEKNASPMQFKTVENISSLVVRAVIFFMDIDSEERGL